MKTAGRYKQKGNLVAAAVIIIVGLAAFGLSVIRTVSSTSVSSSLAMQGYQTSYLAESGLEYGSLQIKNNINLSNPAVYCDGAWKTTQTFGEGQFRFKCTQYVPAVTTSAAITSTSLVIPISATTNVAPIGRVRIDSEQIDYSDVSTSATVCGTAPCLVVKNRGVNNTLATAHGALAAIVQSQLVVEAEGAVPSIASPTAKKTLQKAIALNTLSYTNGWAVGRDGAVYRRYNNQWQRYNVSPSTMYDFNAVTCSSATDCWVAGNGEKLYRWNGTAWTEYTGASFNGTSVALTTVTCVSATDCWVGTGNKDVYHWDGVNWSFSDDLSEVPNSIACVGTNFCIVVAKDGNIYKWDGASWSTMSSGTTRDLNSVSCPSSSMCIAVGENGKILKMTGSTWSSESSPISQDLITVSCSDINNCWAFGTNRDRNARYYYGTWQTQTVAISNKQINGVYCPSYDQCFLAVNRLEANEALIGIWNGLTWGNDFVLSGSAEDLLAVTTDHTASTTIEFENIAWREVFN